MNPIKKQLDLYHILQHTISDVDQRVDYYFIDKSPRYILDQDISWVFTTGLTTLLPYKNTFNVECIKPYIRPQAFTYTGERTLMKTLGLQESIIKSIEDLTIKIYITLSAKFGNKK